MTEGEPSWDSIARIAWSFGCRSRLDFQRAALRACGGKINPAVAGEAWDRVEAAQKEY